MSAPTVLFDKGPLGSGSLFQAPEHIIEAWEPEDVPGAFRKMQRAVKDKKWLAGSAAYELGYVLTPKLRPRLPKERNEPLLRFGVFDGVHPPPPGQDGEPARLTDFEPLWDFHDYADVFNVVRKNLESGDIYQANLTFPMTATLQGSPRGLYERLKTRQAVPHGAYIDLGGTKLLSRSPELFFSLSAEGVLRSRPMKGTIRRGETTDEDIKLKSHLAQSEKDLAENLMITDLLRNDLGRISKIGSVQVPRLFEIESYTTVHQMTSEVVSRVLPGQSLEEIFTALFPCGSITGAPKIRAMEILSELEPRPRDVYCGAIGWVAPDGSMEFSVAIRTLLCSASNSITLNVGGGVVYDSTARGEYDEALLKARFARTMH